MVPDTESCSWAPFTLWRYRRPWTETAESISSRQPTSLAVWNLPVRSSFCLPGREGKILFVDLKGRSAVDILLSFLLEILDKNSVQKLKFKISA